MPSWRRDAIYQLRVATYGFLVARAAWAVALGRGQPRAATVSQRTTPHSRRSVVVEEGRDASSSWVRAGI